jgi:1,4-dihydroxy-2-naphthoyl-CoA synthase
VTSFDGGYGSAYLLNGGAEKSSWNFLF